MKHRVLIIVVLSLILFTGMNSCKKFLDKKPDKKFAVPNTLADLQALLDYYPGMNFSDITATEISSDNYSLIDATWSALAENFRRMYTWEKDFLFAPIANDWFSTYRVIYTANTVLDNIEKIDRTENAVMWDDVKGQALFYKGKSFLAAAFTWTLAYDENTASTDLGLPLRVNSDFNVVSNRSTLKQTYDQIIENLKEASILLPTSTIHAIRPSKTAAYGLLARAYLSMRKYDSCWKYADLYLQLKNTLQPYYATPDFTVGPTFSFSNLNSGTLKKNPEVIFESRMGAVGPLLNTRGRIDSVLVNSYAANDLRKTIFLRSMVTAGITWYGFKGSYAGAAPLFTAVATDEVYLMRAECYARKGEIVAAMKDLNDLLRTRWSRVGGVTTYVNQVANDATDALNKILTERRKELLMRGVRWMDIKRLNKEGANIILKRIINGGQTYILPPNDLRYALPIPEDVISLSGMQQNPR